MKRETISLALNRLDERHISDTVIFSPGGIHGSPERIVHMKKRIITFALAAALMLALGITAYAVWGIPKWTATHNMAGTGEYTSLADVPKVERIVGYEVCLVDKFTNGFTFSKLSVDGWADYDENQTILKEYYGVQACYTATDGAAMSLILAPARESSNSQELRAASSTQMIGDTELRICRDHYKFVPEDYKKTAEDLAAEKSGHYFVSFGAEAIEEKEIVSADFVLNGVVYSLYSDHADGCSDEMLIRMASELIEAAGG